MQTFSINPGKKITFYVKDGFYLAQAMFSIKVLGVPPENNFLNFTIRFSVGGTDVQFHMTLDSPYFFDARTFNPNEFPGGDAYPGPYVQVDVTSSENNPPVVIHVTLTKDFR